LKSSLPDKLRQLATAMQPQIDQNIHPATDSQNWTLRRSHIAQRMHKRGQGFLQIQRTLYNLADLHEQEAVPACIAGIQTRKAIESMLYLQEWPDSGWVVEAYQGTLVKAGITPGNFAEAKQVIMELAGEIDRAALERRQQADKVRSLVGLLPGFFPTPPEVADQMLDLISAEVYQAASKGLTVRILEPSAGAGAIASRIMERWKGWPNGLIKLECVEINYTLRDYLAAQGFLLVGVDFMEFLPPDECRYDYVVMNPPFENHQDMRHIRHAYECLSPGGKVVSVISTGPFFNSDGESVGFCCWLEENGGYSYDLPPGSFNHSGSGVNTRIVVIPKSLEEPEPIPAPMQVTKPEPKPQPQAELPRALPVQEVTRQGTYEQLSLFNL